MTDVATKIDQNITVKNLPAGGFKIPGTKNKNVVGDPNALKKVALEQALEEARKKGQKFNAGEIEKRAAQISKYIQPQRTILCDISCATRLQLEWPRAVAALSFNPLLGTGPSSITEATDNDYLRWLGETGVVGTAAFLFLLYIISRLVWREGKKEKGDIRYIHYGFVFGLVALLVNALYVDVFEASKMAYNFWAVAGIYVGYISLKHKKAKA